jgi:hypothetical protein
MLPKDLAEQVRSQLKRFKDVQDEFLHTYQQLCTRHGGLERQADNSDSEIVFGRVRGEVIPIMEQLGMDQLAVQRLCSWAEGQLRKG